MIVYQFNCHLSLGPSINDFSSEGEGGGPPSKPIYYISLYSNLSQQGEGGPTLFMDGPLSVQIPVQLLLELEPNLLVQNVIELEFELSRM